MMNVMCYGDSNTYGYDPCDRFGVHYPRRWTDILAEKTGWTVINDGFNGREVSAIPISIPMDVDLFLVMLGTNDLLQLDTPEATAERMECFLSGADPQKTVIISPVPMCWGEWVQDQELIDDSIRLASLYKMLSHRLGIRFLNAGDWNIPLCFDGVHITMEGQIIFAEALAKELTK